MFKISAFYKFFSVNQPSSLQKKILNKEGINQIKFSKKNTENELSQKSFVRSFLESIRQKMYSNRN